MTLRHQAALLIATAALLAPAGFAQEFVASGPQLQVNTFTDGTQHGSRVLLSDQDEYVVVWSGPTEDLSREAIFARRFSSAGQPIGDELLVDDNDVTDPDATSRPDGRIVVVSTRSTDGSDIGIAATIYHPELGRESSFIANSHTNGFQQDPSVASWDGGDFVIVWDGVGPGDHEGIWARRFHSDGAPIGDELMVNSLTTHNTLRPGVATTADGGFATVWESYNPNGSAVIYRRFDSTGQPATQGIVLSDVLPTITDTKNPSISGDATGSLVVSWWGYDPGSDFTAVVDRFDSTGQRIALPTQIPDGAFPQAQLDAEGGFVVQWTDVSGYTPLSRGGGVDFPMAARAYAPSGQPVGESILQVSEAHRYGSGALALAPDKSFLVVWDSFISPYGDDFDGSIQARRYELALFADGFETGDLGAWQ